MSKSAPTQRTFYSRTAKTKASAAIKCQFPTRLIKKIKQLDLITEVIEVIAETNGTNVDKKLQSSSSNRPSLKRQRDDDGDKDRNEIQHFKMSKVHENGADKTQKKESQSDSNVPGLGSHITKAENESNQTPQIDEVKKENILNDVQMQNYSFGMLDTDDSTDDEDEIDRKKRPPPPEWSLLKNRLEIINEQGNIDSKTVDGFFGIVEEVDLREVFPGISTKETKRRPSSFYWHSPKRYSMLPKY